MTGEKEQVVKNVETIHSRRRQVMNRKKLFNILTEMSLSGTNE